jgi:hypothetical protein
MVAALEEHCSREVINHDEAIKALKEENETLEAANREEVALFKREKEVLEKDVADAVAAKDLAMQKAKKADEISNHLHEELEVERKLAASLWDQLKEAEVQATVVVGLYRDALGQFGGSTSSLPGCRDVGVSLAWLKSRISKLPDFVGGAIDFGALAGCPPSVAFLDARVAAMFRQFRRRTSPLPLMLVISPRACVGPSGTLLALFGLSSGRLNMAEAHCLEVFRISPCLVRIFCCIFSVSWFLLDGFVGA